MLPALPGELLWEVVYGANSVTLEVTAPGLTGDYNGNGVVDAADYVVWRKGLGTTYTQDHYNVWRANFGQTADRGSLTNGTVPEPATSGMFLVGLLVMPVHRRAVTS